MPKDLSDCLASLRIVDNEEDIPDDSPKINTCKFKGITNSLINEDPACYYNYGSNEFGHGIGLCYQQKTLSLPVNSSLTATVEENTIICALQISSEDIANQITLLDLPCFKLISANELISCGWTKSTKLTITPNVVAFTKRFNQVMFWTVQEILNTNTPKLRAETISHFINIAKRLLELNNLHSLFAIISALQSASIYRLTKSWSHLSKKDKLCFDKMAQIFLEKDNFFSLRDYLKKVSLPCIPYLGLYLTDLVYLDIAHPIGSPNRLKKMSAIIEPLLNFQQSDYNLQLLNNVTVYLKSARYIEELQKFLEDDQYKLSLKLEPPSPSSPGSKESVSKDVGVSPSSCHCGGSLRLPTPAVTFLPTHRKCRSLGSNIFNKNGVEENFDKIMEAGSINLLDDTLLDIPNTILRNLDTSVLKSVRSESGYEGFIRRKTLLKEGRKPSMSCWQRYWLQLWASSLIYFPSKSFKGCTRNDFKCEPCKMQPLKGWMAMMCDSDSKDTFRLFNSSTSSLYKFKADSVASAHLWVIKLQSLVNKIEKQSLPVNLMSFE